MISTKAPAARRAPGSHLAVVDKRHPVTRAFERAIQEGLASPDRQERWKLELAHLTSEAARKFVSFSNIDSMRKALDINLGLLSFALVHQTCGQDNVAAWAGQVVEKPLEYLVGVTLAQIQALVHGRGELVFQELEEPTPRETLLSIATDRKEGVWAGYQSFLAKLQRNSEMHDLDDLARLLIRLTLEKNPQSWLQAQEPIQPAAEEVINTLIFRYCLLQKGERIPEDPSFTPEYVARVTAEYKADRKAWRAFAQERYKHLLDLIPTHLLGWLAKHDWFKKRMAQGPPRWPKEDEEPDDKDVRAYFMYAVVL